MATVESMAALIEAANVATNAIADKITALEEKLKALGLTAEQEAVVEAELGGVVARLKAIGADPADPIPAEP